MIRKVEASHDRFRKACARIDVVSTQRENARGKHILITDATHFVIFEKKRFEFFEQILKFMQE